VKYFRVFIIVMLIYVAIIGVGLAAMSQLGCLNAGKYYRYKEFKFIYKKYYYIDLRASFYGHNKFESVIRGIFYPGIWLLDKCNGQQVDDRKLIKSLTVSIIPKIQPSYNEIVIFDDVKPLQVVVYYDNWFDDYSLDNEDSLKLNVRINGLTSR
jgi:hypothetical protein